MGWPIAQTKPFAGYERPLHIRERNRRRRIWERKTRTERFDNSDGKIDRRHIRFVKEKRRDGFTYPQIRSALMHKFDVNLHQSTIGAIVRGEHHLDESSEG